MDENPYAPPHENESGAAISHGRQQRFRMGMVALLLAMLSSIWLLVAAAHVRADRTNRIPVVTSEGPFAGYVTGITYGALGLSLVALTVSFAVKEHGPHSAANLAILIVVANFLITVIVNLAIYED